MYMEQLGPQERLEIVGLVWFFEWILSILFFSWFSSNQSRSKISTKKIFEQNLNRRVRISSFWSNVASIFKELFKKSGTLIISTSSGQTWNLWENFGLILVCMLYPQTPSWDFAKIRLQYFLSQLKGIFDRIAAVGPKSLSGDRCKKFCVTIISIYR